MNFLDKIFSDKKDKGLSPSKPLKLDDLVQSNDYPILSGDALIELLSLHERIRSIKRALALPQNLVDPWLMTPLKALLESSQLLPASEAHHHKNLGGLAIHQFEVAEYAIRIRKRYKLPLSAQPEDIVDQELAWSYASFCLAMIHDIGKSLYNAQILVKDHANKRNWHILSGPLPTNLRYEIVFGKPNRRLHEHLSNIILPMLIPTEALGYLSQYPQILGQLTNAAFDSTRPEGGTLAEIIRQADAKSVQENLVGTNTVAVSTTVSLIDKLIDALRYLVTEKEVTFNKKGATGFTQGDGYVYLVSKTILDKMIVYLRDQLGDRSIPTDRERLMDILQEHGAIFANEENRAIHRITVIIESSSWTQSFTALKFASSIMFSPGRSPAGGGVKIFADTEVKKTKAKETVIQSDTENKNSENAVSSQNLGEKTKGGKEEEPEAVVSDVKTAEAETSTDQNKGDPLDMLDMMLSYDPEAAKKNAETVTEQSMPQESTDTVDEAEKITSEPGEIKTQNLEDTSSETTTESEVSPIEEEYVPDDVKKEDSEVATIDKKEEAAVIEETKKAENVTKPDYQAIADEFMAWVVEHVVSKTLTTNGPTSIVHRVEEGLFLLSPAIFKRYKGPKDELWKPVQNALSKSTWLVPGKTFHAVRSYVIEIKGKPGTSINGVVVHIPKDLSNLEINIVLKTYDLV